MHANLPVSTPSFFHDLKQEALSTLCIFLVPLFINLFIYFWHLVSWNCNDRWRQCNLILPPRTIGGETIEKTPWSSTEYRRSSFFSRLTVVTWIWIPYLSHVFHLLDSRNRDVVVGRFRLQRRFLAATRFRALLVSVPAWTLLVLAALSEGFSSLQMS